MYYRYTANKDELGLLQAGRLRRSRNWSAFRKDGSIVEEAGLSVSRIPPGQPQCRHAPFYYLVRGKMIALGAEGEPVLDMATLRHVPSNAVCTLPDRKNGTKELLPKQMGMAMPTGAACPVGWDCDTIHGATKMGD